MRTYAPPIPAVRTQKKAFLNQSPRRNSQIHGRRQAVSERRGSPDRPLPSKVRTKMESSFGTSFRDIRVSSDPGVGEAGLAAVAYGSKIRFRPGRFRPNTRRGQELLGHELAHIVQQRQGGVRPTGMALLSGRPMPIHHSAQLEGEADRAGKAAAKGLPAQIRSSGAQQASIPGSTASGPGVVAQGYGDWKDNWKQRVGIMAGLTGIGIAGAMALRRGKPNLTSQMTKHFMQYPNKFFTTPARLRYNPTPNHPMGENNRMEHVLKHAKDNPNKPGKHGVFRDPYNPKNPDPDPIYSVDRAYQQARDAPGPLGTKMNQTVSLGPNVTHTPQPGDRHRYDITPDYLPKGAQTGFVGGQQGNKTGNPATTKVRVVTQTRPGGTPRQDDDIITGFPF